MMCDEYHYLTLIENIEIRVPSVVVDANFSSGQRV